MEIVSRPALETALEELRAHVGNPAEGILGPDSVAWAIGGDVGVFLGGGRAALLQLAHPKVAHAIADHSRTRADAAGRFQRTFAAVFAMVFGTLDDAVAAARRVHAVHARIHGALPVAVGEWSAGTRYHANEIETLAWVHATLVDTTLQVRELFEGPLPRATADRYLVEMQRFAALFGIPAARVPRDRPAHEQYMARMLASAHIVVAPVARETAAFLVGRGRPGPQPILGRIGEAIAHALLPAPLAAQFALAPSPCRTRLGLSAVAALYRRLPRRAVLLPAHAAARARLAGTAPGRWHAWTDRQLAHLATRSSGT